MGATLKDVAALARVSVKTVSNVVNGYPHVSDSVRRRVQDAAAQVGYRPNLAARSLRTGRTGLLALVLPRLDGPALDALTGEIVSAAAGRGYRVVIERATPVHAPQGHGGRALPVDGVLLDADAAPAGLVEAQVAGTPLVLLGAGPDRHCDRVGIDGARAAQDATDHLLTLGRRRIAAIGAHPDEPATGAQPRTVGYRLALRRAGLTVSADYLRSAASHQRSDGYRAAQSLLAHRHPPDAIFCYSDLLAIGAMRAAADAGLRVPDDVAVVGIGDSEEGRYSRPTLSTVGSDPTAIARAAVARIVARIARPDTLPAEVRTPHTLTPRESTRVPASA
ncbi:LacI family transcriptional regulator [Micromonospora sp. R77]|uniref:LacI family DNA-binding transcriptional regulator n=1 Tax=Micromonospora sp. R77 TaxID=2925836 RepID=UPI001F5FF706|nr:LacI family DNA-binding transcriptional regulator [Micromonospora sp. R77]MCI4065996.1 LacI family transcriptional regulator [Micromonospora sp. R77]